ncbi:hypothetical protein Tco_1063521, partial [Tanacetum coccineum]
MKTSNHKESLFRNDGNRFNTESRRFVDVLNGGMSRGEKKINTNKTYNGEIQSNKTEGLTLVRDTKWLGRIIEVEEHELNNTLLRRSVVGELKARCFLAKLLILCEEQGLGAIEVKILEGLEVLVVMENEITMENVLKDKDHGLRRWMYNLRGDCFQRPTGWTTWITILGVPVSCWGEGVVQIHTNNKGLINEEVTLYVDGKSHRVSVINEVRDIAIIDIQDKGNGGHAENGNGDEQVDENVMQIDEEEDDKEGEPDGGDEDSSEDEDGGRQNAGCDDGGGPVAGSGGRGDGEDDGSSFSGETKVLHGEVNRMLNAQRRGESLIGDHSRLKSGENSSSGKNNDGQSCKENGHVVGSKEGDACGLDKMAVQEGSKWKEGNSDSELRVTPTSRREKREVSPSSSAGSGKIRISKKRKDSVDSVFGDYEFEATFKQGIANEEKSEGKNKIGRKSVKWRGKPELKIQMEQIKEIREMIGVSWVRVEEEKKANDREGGVVDDNWIENLWGGQGYGYAHLPTIGNSGGIILIWDARVFACKEAVGDKRFIAVKGDWKGKNVDVFLVNLKEMMDFNDFINNMRLIEAPMGGRKFTRVSDDGMKFIVALDRKLSDHCPIVIKDMELDFGPKPFRIFNIWMDEPDFFKVVEEAWGKEVRSYRPDCIFRDKLKNVKASLRGWSKMRFGGHKEKVENLRNVAMKWEQEAEKRTLTDSERTSWLETRKQWEEKERESGNMIRKKARIKWAIEGDENSKFFHSHVRRRNNKYNIRGLMINGIWCEEPKSIKEEIARHFKNLFSEGRKIRPIFCSNKIEKISIEDAHILERGFEEKEVWEAI